MATQKPLAYHFPLSLGSDFNLVAANPQGEMVAELASKYGDRLQNMTPEQARIHAQEALAAEDWLAMAAISMAMANL